MGCCSEESSCSGGGCCGCGQKRETSMCMCLPYKDGFMITAQIISIVAFLVSWVWWVTFIVGLISLALLQLVWCCRQSKIGMFVSVGISTLAGITCTIAGIVMIVVWKDQKNCSVFTLTDGSEDDYYDNYVTPIHDDTYCNDGYNNTSYDDCYYNRNNNDYMDNYAEERRNRDYCEEQAWAVVAFITATLWFSTSGLILYFVGSGRYAIWEEEAKLQGASDTTSTTAIEMGAVQHQYDGHQQEQQTTTGANSFATAATTAIATATDHDLTTCNTADSYVLPDISNKVDNV